MQTTRTALLAGVLLALLGGLLACEISGEPTADVTTAPTIPATVSPSPHATSTATPLETDISTSPTATPIPSNQFSIAVAEIPRDVPPYDRDDWRHWTDEDRDCQDTRQEVLVAESRVDVAFRSENECRVTEGSWFAAYTGTTVTNPGDLDIDHLVPLFNAHRSGGWAWSPEQKRAYANSLDDPDHLIAVTARANRSKGAKGPEEWRPPDESYWCEYAMDWIRVKQAWNLSATLAEADALMAMLATCDEPTELVTTIAAAPTVAPDPAVSPISDRVYSSCDEAEAAGEERIQGSSDSGRGFSAGMVPSARDGDGDGIVCER